VIATATCYIEVGAGLTGGGVEFARQAEVWVDDPEATHTVRPAAGTLLAFNNALLRHRVGTASGHGRRRLAAFHVIDPRHPQQPAAAELPHQLTMLSAQQLAERRDASRHHRLAPPARRRSLRTATGFHMAPLRRGTGVRRAPEPRSGTGYAFGTGMSYGTGTSYVTGTRSRGEPSSPQEAAPGEAPPVPPPVGAGTGGEPRPILHEESDARLIALLTGRRDDTGRNPVGERCVLM